MPVVALLINRYVPLSFGGWVGFMVWEKVDRMAWQNHTYGTH